MSKRALRLDAIRSQTQTRNDLQSSIELVMEAAREAGATYREIADAADMTPEGVRKLLQRNRSCPA